MAKPSKHIPQDIIDKKILPCLPVKSLMRFKCVCKSWSSFITSPQFTMYHLERALSQNPKTISPKLLILLSCGFKSLDLEKSFDNERAALIGRGCWPNEHHRILGSCHGLVCFCVENDLRCFFLLNPSTGESKQLPECELLKDKWHLQFKHYGLGYDSSSDDYKLLLHIDRMTMIFSLAQNSWRRIHEPWSVRNTFYKKGFYSNGALHWQFRHGGCIFAFDLKMETFDLVASMSNFHGRRLFGVGETLYYIKKEVTDDSLVVFEFWCSFQGSWTKILSFPSNGVPYLLDHLLSISKGNQLITENGEDVIRFDAEGEIVEKIRMCDSPSWCERGRWTALHPCDAISYVETLVSPNRNAQSINSSEGGRTVGRRGRSRGHALVIREDQI